jgi:RNA polymerase sigma factor (sigma-70 family)
MPTPETQEFLAVLQSGDPHAVDELLRRLDPFLRRVIRQRLLDGRLRRTVDTTDIWQSLLKDFLRVRESREPSSQASEELCAYLAAAVHHKIQTRLRKERRHAGSLPADWEPVSREPKIGAELDDQDFTDTVRARLDESSRQLLNLKAQGLSWAEVAAQLGSTSDALRMRLRREVAAVLSELS